MFFAFLKLTIIIGAIFPLLFSVSIFQVIDPQPDILRPILVIVHALPVGSVIHELPFIHISIQVIESSLAIGFPLTPFTFVFGAILPLLTPEAVFN